MKVKFCERNRLRESFCCTGEVVGRWVVRMSKARKHVEQSLDSLPLPDLALHEDVFRVLEVRGGNQIEIDLGEGKSTLCLIPAKFRKKLWIRNGQFVIAELCPSENDHYKVQAILKNVLYDNQVKYIKRMGKWPARYDSAIAVDAEATPNADEEDEDEEAVSPKEKTNASSKVSSGGRPDRVVSNSGSDASEENDDDDPLFQNPNRGRLMGRPCDRGRRPVTEDSEESDT